MDIGSAPSGRVVSGRRVRVLHSVGHLLRGGIETWLYGAIRKLDSGQFEHHVMVRTDKDEAFTAAFRETGAKVLPCRQLPQSGAGTWAIRHPSRAWQQPKRVDGVAPGRAGGNQALHCP
jgi:hypothetical protein